MIKYAALVLLSLILSVSLLAQRSFQIIHDDPSTGYSLREMSSGKIIFKECQSIELVSDTLDSKVSELYIISRNGKLTLFDGLTKTSVWQRAVRKSGSTHERADYNGVHELVGYSPERREAILFSGKGMLYPSSAVSRYPDDFAPLDPDRNFFSVGVVDEVTGDYHEGVVDREGKLVIPIEYDNVETYYDDLRAFKIEKDKKVGVVNLDGSVLFPPQYDAIIPANGRFVASLEDKVGVISAKEELLPFVFKFQKIRDKEGSFRNGKFNLLFNENPIAIDTSALALARARNYLATYKSHMYYSRFVTHYDEKSFADEKSVWRIVDSVTGKETIPRGYSKGVEQDVVELRGGVAVAKDGKFGVLNIETGEPMIPLEYDIPYIKGNGSFKYNEDAFHARVIRMDMKEISDTNVVIVVRKDGKSALVDLRGKLVFPFVYDEIYPDTRCEELDLILVKQAGRYGMIDEKTFELVIPCEYEAVMDCAKGKKYLGDSEYVPLTRK